MEKILNENMEDIIIGSMTFQGKRNPGFMEQDNLCCRKRCPLLKAASLEKTGNEEKKALSTHSSGLVRKINLISFQQNA